MRCLDGLLNWREQGHRREPGQVDSCFWDGSERNHKRKEDIRAIGVTRRETRDQAAGLGLDLVKRELHGRQVGPREMRRQVFRRGEQRRQVRTGCHGGKNNAA